jgi:hypothetical protein
MGSLTRPNGRRLAVWSALALGWMLPTTGCQVEYAGMTLPSGKYMHDDVQYFTPGPSFPWANTQAATQRARMQAMGIEAPPAPGVGGPFAIQAPPGTLDPTQNQGVSPTDVNTDPNAGQPVRAPAPPVPGAPAPAPGAEIPPPAPGVAPPPVGQPAPPGPP